LIRIKGGVVVGEQNCANIEWHNECLLLGLDSQHQARMPIEPLPTEALYRRCDPSQLAFETTAELEELTDLPGQARAIDAVRFGIGIKRQGYNLFVLGNPGSGKHGMTREFLKRAAASGPTPLDLCYVNNFEDPQRPVALRVPAGIAAKLRTDMAELVRDLKSAIPSLFESEDYRNRRRVIEEEFKHRQEAAFEQLQESGKSKNLVLVRTPVGFAVAPVRDGAVISPEDFQKLPEAEQQQTQADIEELQAALEQTIRQMPKWDKERRERIRELNREVTMFAVGHVMDELRAKYRDFADIAAHLNAVEKDIIDHVDAFLATPAERPPAPAEGAPARLADGDRFRRYQVNVLVDSSTVVGAPVVYEDNPTYMNLVGAVEHLAEMGTLVTDFGLIRSGALHRANGGYLLLDAHKLLMQPFAWEALKRALRSKEIRIETPAQMLSLVSTVTLTPQPVPLEVKVVLVAERWLYYLLSQYDFEFHELFKVAVDFEDDMQWSAEATATYARLIATMVKREALKPLDRGAVARAIEHSARLADDAAKLSMQIGDLADVLREADYWAGEAGRAAIHAEDVQLAIDARRKRSDRVRERSQEMIQRGLILIDTEGAKVGQVNGLSVLALGSLAFGKPSRITAKVRLGRGEVVDIERQVELGGPIHSKGVMILSAFLAARYAREHPLSLWASLVFEQSYGGVEGDSASSAELYALLSALADLPIKQSFAVTGSVNQHGDVQVIGGVNEKIEGFYDTCAARGLNGEQGVLIPAGNVTHLMLRRDVVDAAAAGRFRIYPVRTIDEGVELLTGVTAGARDGDGSFPQGTLNRRVEDRLIALAEQRRRFGTAGGGEAS
jgi:lon-related putative ATP-dependent protease